MIGLIMRNELEIMWKEGVVAFISLEELRKTMKQSQSGQPMWSKRINHKILSLIVIIYSKLK
jgi:hypothetical protein